ncbi:YncE family protein [Antrihabitans cavernicola]|uniref:YncE family protein n=1 Tax=Antrihabitans cavernicola TaxID=2495913 RepID=A0A5A7SAI1_9NOCA|nr:hypothetical protein [Spelaeibacter cavernicola]KAA0021535.1 hypothetical protein FOY51_18470 [Spelaeibacter cavernicola]
MVSFVGLPAIASANPSIPGSSSGAAGPIWLPNYGNDSIIAINPATMQIETTIPNAGDHPLVIKEETPDHSRLFVANFGPFSSYISVIDVASRSVITRIPTLLASYCVIQLSHDGRYLYVPTAASVMQVIDTHSLAVVRTIPLWLPPSIGHVELSPDDKQFYTVNSAGFGTKYDTASGAPLAPPIFLDGTAGGWGATSTDGRTFYSVNFFGGVTAVDTQSWRVKYVIPTAISDGPISATLTPDGRQIWICNYQANNIIVADTATGAIVRTIPTQGGAVYAGFSGDGKTAYITTVADGAWLPAWNPLIGQYYAKDEAYWATLLNLDTSVSAYDIPTGTFGKSLTVKGAFTAGTYPG